MTAWQRKLGLIGFSVLFLGAAILVALLPAGGPLPSAVLSDGRVLEVRSITVGTNHQYHTEIGWKSRLRTLLPRSMTGWLGSSRKPVLKRTMRDPALVVWIETTPPKGVDPERYHPKMENLRVLADHGEKFDCHGWPLREAMPDSVMLPLIVSVYPRRADTFTVTGTIDGAEFSLRVSNPDRFRDAVSALPSELPVTNGLGDVDVILRSGQITTFDWGYGPELEFEFWKNGTNATDQFGKWWSVSDVTGNTGWRVPTNEPIWMIETAYYRTKSVDWPADRVHSITITNSLSPMEHRTFRPAEVLAGTTIESVWIGGAGTYTWIDGVIDSAIEPPVDGKTQPYHGSHTSDGKQMLEWGRADPWVMVDTTRIEHSKCYLSVFLIDSRGTEAAVERHTKLNWGRMGVTVFHLPREKNPSLTLIPPLTIQVVMQDLKHAMFAIDPADLARIRKRTANAK